MYFPFYWIIKLFIWKESVNSDGQQFHQYQQKQTIASHLMFDKEIIERVKNSKKVNSEQWIYISCS
jgi:hypothetical protein